VSAIRILEQPHDEARRLIAGGAPVWITVNPVEYHGPHLSLHNDRLVSLGLVHDLHRRLAARHPEWPLLLGDDLEIGVEPCPGPGTRHATYAATRALVRETCRSLVELGARRVVIMTFHGAPLHNVAIQEGVDLLRRANVHALAPFHIALRELLDLDDPARFEDALAPIAAASDREAMRRGIKQDFHAGFFETSIALHYAPASVSSCHRDLPPCPAFEPDPKFAAASRTARWLGRELLARELEFAAWGVGWNALRPFPGYTGRPHLASAASGERFAAHILDVYEPIALAVLEGRAEPPPPIMRWVAAASAGGRIGGLSRPDPTQIAALPRVTPA
jgi:creatinine amidohydrolase